MHRVPGKEIGTTNVVENIPEGVVEVPYLCEGVLKEVEKMIKDLVSGVKRTVKAESIEYTTSDGKVFLRIRFREKSIRLIMPGNELTFVDPHKRTRKLSVPEWGGENMEFVMNNLDQITIAEEYITTSLCMINYYKPPEHDEDEDDEFSIELSNGSYDGPVVDGKPHGIGKFTWDDGSAYEGSFIGGAVSGHGKYTRSNGDVFEGYFVNGKISKMEKGSEGHNKAPVKETKPVFTFGYIF